MTKQETDNHNLACLHAYMLETGVKPEDFDSLPFGEDGETQCYHTKEAATAHLESVGLTFECFWSWLLERGEKVSVSEDACFIYPASTLRQYIRDNHQLNDKK